MFKQFTTPRYWLFGPTLCLLSGCAVHRVDEEANLLEVEVPASFSEPATGASLPNDWNYSWWESFEDEDLNRLIETGLATNFGLRQYVARIEQATALARRAGANLYPSLDLTAGYGSEWDGKTGARESRDRTDSSGLGVLLRWELDVWGRLSSIRRAENMAAQATVEDWLGARLLLSSAIAETYFEIKERLRQLEVIQAQLEINESLLKLTTLRFGQGQSSIVDVLQQQEQLEATLARVPLTEAQIGQLEYSLDVLLGQTPGAGAMVTSSFLGRPPPLPSVGIPAQLLTRRPDLRGAQKRVLAFDYDVGVSVADQFPSLVLGGSIDWRGDPSLGDEITAVFARLAAPLFNAGELRGEVSFRKARLDEALAGYSERYLSALFEVEAALLEERKNEERLVLVEKQLDTAQRLLSEARNRFSQGLTDYLPVFTSLSIVQNLEREVVSSRRSVLSARVGLHRALGGPILNPDTPVLLSSLNE
ncbi:MAG: efflux transporter outer membrane subunit [Verrucomicrobia bacterium]|nr:efflux transporter outer membrane subunit [Verrucomicrobiota bacterium]